MIVWMLSSVAASALLALAAQLGEPALRARRMPVRWLWAAALVASVALPARALVAPAPAAVRTVVPAEFSPAALALLDRAAAAAPSLADRAEPLLPAAWLGMSGLVGLVLLGGLVRLALRARGWPRAELAGVPVLVSERFGPAVLGVVRSRIVVPRWVLDLDPHRRRMVLLHEEEHRRAGDAPLLALGAVAVVATPWNPVCWWLLHRLRGAVEMDCDARVIARGVDVPAYGRLLLDLGTRVEGPGLAVAAFAKPRSLLERRLTTMVRGERGTRTRGALALLAGVALVAVACETPVGMALPGESDVPETLIEEATERAAAGAVDDFTVASEGRVVRDEDAPLIYVDGELVEGTSALPDPTTIERIEVLKGAAAERRVGPEGRNGVIYVHTKKGEPTIIVNERAPAGVIGARLPGTAEGEFRFRSPEADASAGNGGVIRQRADRPGGEFRFQPR